MAQRASGALPPTPSRSLRRSLVLLLLLTAPQAAARVLPSDYWLSKRASLTEAIWGYGASLPTRAKPDAVSPTNVTGVTEIAWDLGSPGPGAPSLTSRVYQVLRQHGGGQGVSSDVQAPRRAKKAFLLHRKRFRTAHGEQAHELYKRCLYKPSTTARAGPAQRPFPPYPARLRAPSLPRAPSGSSVCVRSLSSPPPRLTFVSVAALCPPPSLSLPPSSALLSHSLSHRRALKSAGEGRYLV
jgi:hypothetical protein